MPKLMPASTLAPIMSMPYITWAGFRIY